MPGTLFYDGDCGFCRRWVSYWRQLIGERAAATPYQEAAPLHPEIPLADFRRAVQYIDENGARFSGAAAIFESLRPVAGCAWLAWAYRHVPLFAPASDWVYREVAGHRKSATWITRLLWGASLELPTYGKSVYLFRRALAIIYLIAFVSFGIQVLALIGSQGILPAQPYLDAVFREAGASSFWRAPTLFWWWKGDFALQAACWLGAALAIVCALGRFQRAIFAGLFILYLSLVTAGQVFMGYQWDFLLLEAGFLAIFLTPSWPRVWLGQWLLFRLMFESGCVKLLSHDPTWANLTALSFHYQTQPLPTPLAWYAMQAPLWVHKGSTLATFAIELLAPFLIFGPRRMKHLAALAFVVLQSSIMLTGNYAYFNILSIALCILLLDDRFWDRWSTRWRVFEPPARPVLSRGVTAALMVIILVASGVEIASMFSVASPAAARDLVEITAPFGIVNSYGLFATMTTVRLEIEVEGSDDGEHWQSYAFRFKPGDPARAPRWVAPYQPRLDWQMWFASLGTYRDNPWFTNFMVSLLSGSPPVSRLLERDPFRGVRPRFVRAEMFEYRYSDVKHRTETGQWWVRERKGLYFPTAGLQNEPTR